MQKIAWLLCAVLTAGAFPLFASCGEEGSLSSISKGNVKGVSFSALHEWDLVDWNGNSALGGKMGEEVEYRYSFFRDSFLFDGRKTSENTQEAKARGVRYEENFFFRREGKTYLSDTYFLDEKDRSWTFEDILYPLPVGGKDGFSTLYPGISPGDIPDDYETPNDFVSLSQTRLQNLAYAAKASGVGSYHARSGGYAYDVDLLALYSPWVDKGKDFLLTLDENTTMREVVQSDFMRERFSVFLVDCPASSYVKEVKFLFDTGFPLADLSASASLEETKENFPAPQKRQTAYDYVESLLDLPFGGKRMGDVVLYELFPDEAFLSAETLRARLQKIFLDPFEGKIKTRLDGFDENSFSLLFSRNGSFVGLDWSKKKFSDYGLYSMQNEYLLSVRFLAKRPKLKNVSACQTQKIDSVKDE